LVTGGAGYIGSHTLKALERANYSPICFDNLSTGYRGFADGYPFVQGSLENPADLEPALDSSGAVDAVMHFASHALVGESFHNPFKYYHDNIVNALNLLEAMRKRGIRYFVFSSSCSTYGIPSRVPILESEPLDPINPYGATKMIIERILSDYEKAFGIRFVSLRYFNAAGADAEGSIGENHIPETHLIPRLFEVAMGRAPAAQVYGNDYPTPDGTCIRDYIHVTDLAAAHVAALAYLLSGNNSDIFNLGTGKGFSVLQVLDQVRKSTGKEVPVETVPRRPGDPPELVADPRKAQAALRWHARHSSLEEIVESAWNWHRAHV
jgi:UDP-glucose 4-epimerase